ncbi:MAG: YibE/F family protein, partial [Fretibacterium sp.]|nr:YibE/F family protein [Fretibacterium sp.]
YLGVSLPMTVLISSAGADVKGLLNDPYIGQEIVQSLAGTAGLLLTIPMTALFFVLQEGWERRRQVRNDQEFIPEEDGEEGA